MAAAQAGLPDSTIQTLGRWNSTAFMSYFPTPRHQLATLTDKFMWIILLYRFLFLHLL